MRDYLVTCGLTSSTTRAGGLPASPDAVVATLAYGGTPPVLAMGSQNVVERVMMVQVLVRGDVNGYATAAALAETIFGYIVNALNVTVNSHFYDKIIASSEPLQLIPDNEARPLFSLNVEMWRRGL